MKQTQLIEKDLIESLRKLDKNNYVLNSIINHLEVECTDAEIKVVEGGIYDLLSNKYTNKKDFIEDYQPIFDLIDFPLDLCFKILKRRTFNISDFNKID